MGRRLRTLVLALGLLLALAPCVDAAASIAQSTHAGSSAPSSPQSAAFSSNVTSGNFIVVFTRCGAVGVTASVSDTLTLTYTHQSGGSNVSQDPGIETFTAPVTSSGADTVSVSWSASNAFSWFRAIEVTGQASVSPVDAIDVIASGGGVTSLVSNAITTTTAGIILVAAAQNNFVNPYTAGTDFTIISGTEGDGTNPVGGTEYYVTSGALTGYVAHITSTVTNEYTMATIAIKASGGGGGGSSAPSAFTLGIPGQ